MQHALSFSGLPADVVEYVLNFCGWEWFKGAEESRRRLMSSKVITEGVSKILGVRRHTVGGEEELASTGGASGMVRRRRGSGSCRMS